MNKELIGQLTPEKVQELAKSNPGAFSIEVDGHIAYFKKPDRHIINFAMEQQGLPGSKPLDYFSNIANDTFLEGSRVILEDDDLFMNVVNEFKSIIEFNRGKLVKL